MSPVLARITAGARWVWWALLAAVAVAAIIAARILFGKREEPVLAPVPEALRAKVAQAEEDGLRARVTASTQAAAKREELATVARVQQGAERRRRLADLLRND